VEDILTPLPHKNRVKNNKILGKFFKNLQAIVSKLQQTKI
jgi:hypothetical protein